MNDTEKLAKVKALIQEYCNYKNYPYDAEIDAKQSLAEEIARTIGYEIKDREEAEQLAKVEASAAEILVRNSSINPEFFNPRFNGRHYLAYKVLVDIRNGADMTHISSYLRDTLSFGYYVDEHTSGRYDAAEYIALSLGWSHPWK